MGEIADEGVFFTDSDFAGFDRDKAKNGANESGFAGAVFADDIDEVAVVDTEGGVFDDKVFVERDGETFELDDGRFFDGRIRH